MARQSEIRQFYLFEALGKNSPIGALRGSALELDIYTWLTHRLWRIRDPKGVLVKWEDLKSQFGEEYDKLFHFKTALESVYRVYPDAKVEPGPDGLLLRESRPPIPRKAIR